MPPVNTSFGTAVDLGILPADVTQTDIHDGGTGLNYTVYYKFTAPVNARVIGAWGFETIADPYRCIIRAYDSSFVNILSIAGTNIPIQFPVTGGDQYYLEFAKTNNLTPATLRVRAEVAPLGNIVNGNICVNDDTHGFPLAVLSHHTDYEVINFVLNIVAGESGCRLPNGPICLEDRDNTLLAFYNPIDFSLIRNDTSLGANTLVVRSCIGANRIYAGSRTSPSVVKAFNNLGIPVVTHTLSTNNIAALAANTSETVLYYANFGTNEAIRRWDLVNDVPLSDLVAGSVGISINDILFMPDGTIVSVHEDLAGTAVNCKNYNAAGALLHTYACPANFGTFSKLAYATADDTSFWNWTHDNTGRSRFQNIRISDGVVLTDRLMQEYEGGAMNAGETATPLSRFGNSFSCPFFIFSAPAPPGMFIVTPNKRTDHDGNNDVKIPNPTFKTALMP